MALCYVDVVCDDGWAVCIATVLPDKHFVGRSRWLYHSYIMPSGQSTS